MRKNVSIVDVARHAGVSVSTVSLVMNNRPNVAPDTANAVWVSVKELGYHPGGDGKKRGPKPGPRKNRQFSAMGLLMTGMPGACLWSSYYLRAMQGIHAALAERQVNLALYHIEDAAEARETLRRNQLDGVILFGAAEDEDLVEYLRRQVCVQVFGRLPGQAMWDLVSCDNGSVGRLGAQHLLRLGHEEVAFIGTADPVARERGDGFEREVQAASKRAKLIHEEKLVTFSNSRSVVDRERLAAIARSLLPGGGSGPTGVFLCSDLLAAGFYAALYESGLLPAQSLDLVCCNSRFPHLVGAYPPPTVIDIHAEQVGRQAVDQVMWRREHRNEPHVVRLITPRIQPAEDRS